MRADENFSNKTAIPAMSNEEFRKLGSSHVVYTRKLSKTETAMLLAKLDHEDVPGNECWGLFGATGELLAMGNSPQHMADMAFHNNMVMASLN